MTDWLREARRVLAGAPASALALALSSPEPTPTEELMARRGRWKLRRALLPSALASTGVPDKTAQVALETQPSADDAMRLDEYTGRSLYLHGGTGTGKSVFAARVVLRALRERAIVLSRDEPSDIGDAPERGRVDFAGGVRWLLVPELFAQLRAAMRDQDLSPDGMLLALCELDLLVLDDIGQERATDWVSDGMATLIHKREAKRKQTVFTSNLTVGQLTSRFGENGKRIASRLNGWCDEIKFDGPDRRVTAKEKT